MVDSISGLGASPLSGSRTQATEPANERKETSKTSKSESSSDRVEISTEAVSLAQAEALSRDVSRELSENTEQYLGLDPSFDEAV